MSLDGVLIIANYTIIHSHCFELPVSDDRDRLYKKFESDSGLLIYSMIFRLLKWFLTKVESSSFLEDHLMMQPMQLDIYSCTYKQKHVLLY